MRVSAALVYKVSSRSRHMNTFQTEAPAQVLHEIARSRIFGNVVWQRSVSAALKAHRFLSPENASSEYWMSAIRRILRRAFRRMPSSHIDGRVKRLTKIGMAMIFRRSPSAVLWQSPKVSSGC